MRLSEIVHTDDRQRAHHHIQTIFLLLLRLGISPQQKSYVLRIDSISVKNIHLHKTIFSKTSP